MNLTPLALGCLFHDLGMMGLEHLYNQPGPLSPEDLQRVREHPDQGAAKLPEEFDAVARMVVRTHHENMDGTGYPRGLAGEALHVFSRIIRVADALDAGTSSRVYHKAKTAARVLWEMAGSAHISRYDQTVVKILMGLVQPFPIGAKIRLNDGKYGVVVRHNRKEPFRPTIIVAFDEDGKKLRKQQLAPPIDLARHDEIRLTEFAGDDLSFLNQGDADATWGRPAEPIVEDDQSLFALVYP